MRAGILVLAAGILANGMAHSQEMPSALEIVGTVHSRDNATPPAGSQVIVVDRNSGLSVATGSVVDGQGSFFVMMMKQASFNGTVLNLQIIQSNVVYVLNEGPKPAEFPYSGNFPFPARVNKTVTYETAPPAAAPASRGAANPFLRLDFNRDGVFDEKDIAIMVDALLTDPANLLYDVNGDGVFDSRDVIEARRILRARK